MIIVRNIFTAKPGQGSKLAAQFKTAAAAAKLPKHRVLTDVTGEFNRVVLEYEVDSIGGFEAQMKDYLGAVGYRFTAEDEALVDSLVTTGHSSTPRYNDPAYPIEGRLPRSG